MTCTSQRLRTVLILAAFALWPFAPAKAALRTTYWSGPQTTSIGGIELSEFQARRRAALGALKDGILVLRGSVEEEFGEVGRFHQNNWVYYLSGCEVPGALLMLNPFAAEGNREALYLPGRNPFSERWTGPQIGPGTEGQQVYGFESVRDVKSFDVDLEDALRSAAAARTEASPPKLFGVFPTGKYAEFSFDTGFANRVNELAAKTGIPGLKIADASLPLGELRRTKSDAELALIRKAIEITGEAQHDAGRMVAPSRWEYEIEAVIVAAFLRNGAQRAGFPSIVGSGINSTILHYANNSKRIDEGDLVVCDIGAEFNYYTADITRTWPASGKFTDRQRDVYNLVLASQREAEKSFKIGMTMRDLNLVAIEVMRKSPLRDKDGRTLDTYFIHGLGHFLGMDVHDVGVYDVALKPGDVITIEPGIYIGPERLGVRIEDDYLVTANGLVKLSASIPSTADEIEAIAKGKRTGAQK